MKVVVLAKSNMNRHFGESELFRQHAGLGAGGLSMPEVDEKVHSIIKVVG